MITVSQDPNAHLFYEVEWADWLAYRNYTVDQIVSMEWSSNSIEIEITYVRNEGSKSTAWVRGVPAGAKVKMTCRIAMPPPAPGKPYVTDDYTFQIFGKHK